MEDAMKRKVKRLAALLLAALMLLASGCKKKEEVVEEAKDSGFRIGYAEGVTVIDDEDSLQAEYNKMLDASQQEGMAIEFTNEAVSLDGINVDCHIGSSSSNSYDMFIIIYGDEQYTDQLFLSELLRPGTAFEHIQLEHALDPGFYTLYVVYTTVEEINGVQGIHDQQIVTMNLTVFDKQSQEQEPEEENGQ